MAVHVAFLRGINVGGHRASKQQLCEAFEAVGHLDVVTFRASGNVIFDAKARRSAKLISEIETSLADVLGYEVPTFVRTAPELKAVANFQPFSAKAVANSKGKPQVTFLGAPPKPAAKKQILSLALDSDPLAIEGSELYWLPSGGQMETELDLKQIDRLTGPNTRRTMGTVEQIAAKL